MSLIIKIEGTDVNTGIDLDRNVRESVSFKGTHELKRSMSCGVYYKASETLPLEGQDIEVFNGVELLFGGIIKTISYESTTPQKGNSAWIKLSISSDGYNFIPQRRTVNADYTATDAGTIVSAMITSFLTDEGITAGTISTGATIDRYLATYKSIKEVLDDMADASGFSWNINDAKQLDFIALTTPTNSTSSIVEGERTHFDFQPTRSLGSFRNKQYVEGGTDSTGATVRVVVEDSVSIAARAASEGNSGVYGNVVRDSTIQTATDATAAATEYLNSNKDAATCTFGSYEDYTVGELIPITYTKYDISAATKYLILSKTTKRNGHKWVYAYDCEVRDDTDYSGKAKLDSIDFYSKMSKGTIYTESSGVSGGTGVKIYVQDAEPTAANEKDVFIDTNDYSNVDGPVIIASTTVDLSLGYSIICNSPTAIVLTLPDILTLFAGTTASLTDAQVLFRVSNKGVGAVTMVGTGANTINGVATPYAMVNRIETVIAHRTLIDWTVG